MKANGSSSAEEVFCAGVSRAEISSLRMRFSSAVPTYLSRATRSSMRRMMSMVVSVPTSEEMRISSSWSSTSSSTVDLPAMACASLLKIPVLVFSKPFCRTSCFCFFEKKLKKLIYILYNNVYAISIAVLTLAVSNFSAAWLRFKFQTSQAFSIQFSPREDFFGGEVRQYPNSSSAFTVMLPRV